MQSKSIIQNKLIVQPAKADMSVHLDLRVRFAGRKHQTKWQRAQEEDR